MRYKELGLNPTFNECIYGSNSPHCLIIGGQHGDERSPVNYCNYLNQALSNTDVKGKITIIPCANVVAWRNNSREVREIDLNRNYGETNNILTKISERIKNIVLDCDYVIDFHSTPAEFLKKPLITFDPNTNSKDLLGYFDFKLYPSESPENSLRHFCKKNNVPCITVEFVDSEEFHEENFNRSHKSMKAFLRGEGII